MKTYSHDDLGRLSEDDLKNHFLQVRSSINTLKRKNMPVKQLEIYCCYVIRELENRSLMQHKE